VAAPATRLQSERKDTMTDQPSWELSGFGDEIDADPVVQVAVLQALGASAIEVRSAWGVNVVDLDEDQLAGLHRLLDERGQTVSAIASPIGKVPVDEPVEHEVSRLARAIRAAHALGTTNIRIFSFYFEGRAPDDVRDDVLVRMRALADLAEREGVTLLHENEKDIYGDVPARVLESVGSSALRLAWDNANYVQCGVRPFTDGWEQLAPYVDYLQVKDALAADSSVVPAGEGDGELVETLTALRDAGYSGYASLEPHLSDFTSLGGFSGPAAFGRAGRAFRTLTDQIGVTLR
jgi:sugar phosphate isomerase/epimerase